MSKLQKSSNDIFVDYVPAELKENKEWLIIYYAKNPYSQKLKRKRLRVPPMKNTVERRKMARKMVNAINERLSSGWNPFYQNKGSRETTTVAEALRIFTNRIKIEYEDENLRYDTYKTYKSQCNMLNFYINDVLLQTDMFCYQIDEDFIGNYLDYIRYERGRSARTRDNYLGFLKTITSFFIRKKYLTKNPTINFHKINRKEKRRSLINKSLKALIFEYLEKTNESYLTLCMVCYYCLIRRTELTKITVDDVSITNSTIWIDASDSKNRRSKHVTIPDVLLPVLANHIKNAKTTDFLFSANNFHAGERKLRPDRITRMWEYMRKDLEIGKEIHWYSLKDSGITDLLAAGVPLIAVRDQARHHSSAQTDAYTPRKILKANQDIKTAAL